MINTRTLALFSASQAVKAFCLFLSLLSVGTHAETKITEFTILGGIDDKDARHIYEQQLLQLALGKTEKEYGAYRLILAPPMTHARGIESMRQNKLPNFVRTFGFDPDLSEKYGFGYVKYPIHRGIVSYRTCLIPSTLKDDIAKTKNKKDLEKYLLGTGVGWTDTTVLRDNGFRVKEVGNYTSLFKMTAAGRIELFCRGTNEILEEYTRYSSLDGLDYDRSMSLHYPIPLLLYTNSANKEALERIEKGIKLSLTDGSLVKLWREHYRKSIEFAQLEKRRVFRLKSPYIDAINFDYEQYFFDPNNLDK